MKLYLLIKTLFFILIFPFNCLFAQQDVNASKILEKFAENNSKLKSYYVDFKIMIHHKQNGMQEESTGSILVSGKKYKMILPEQEVYSNGIEMHTFLKDSKEVNITMVNTDEDNENTFMEDPTKIFTLYHKNYKYKLIGDAQVYGRKCKEIDLYPTLLKTSYFRIKLYIDPVLNELVTMKTSAKSGTDIEVKIIKFSKNVPVENNDFIFQQNQYKDLIINDMRF